MIKCVNGKCTLKGRGIVLLGELSVIVRTLKESGCNDKAIKIALESANTAELTTAIMDLLKMPKTEE